MADKIVLIVATDCNWLIGKDGALPWRSRLDMQWFRSVTMGNAVIMGRKTWQSIPIELRPLYGRTNIVISSGSTIKYAHATVGGLQEAINCAQAVEPETIFIIGGAQVYKQALDYGVLTDILHTKVEGEYEGDTYLNLNIDLRGYPIVGSKFFSDPDGPDISFNHYSKNSKASHLEFLEQAAKLNPGSIEQ